MSVFYCEGCDKLIDSDFIECEEVDDKLVCVDCLDAEQEKPFIEADYRRDQAIDDKLTGDL